MLERTHEREALHFVLSQGSCQRTPFNRRLDHDLSDSFRRIEIPDARNGPPLLGLANLPVLHLF